MYKILVIASRHNSGCTSQVIQFDTKRESDEAYIKLTEIKSRYHVIDYLKLYED